MPYNVVGTVGRRKRICHCDSATDARAKMQTLAAEGCADARVVTNEGVILSDERLDTIAAIEEKSTKLRGPRSAA